MTLASGKCLRATSEASNRWRINNINCLSGTNEIRRAKSFNCIAAESLFKITFHMPDHHFYYDVLQMARAAELRSADIHLFIHMLLAIIHMLWRQKTLCVLHIVKWKEWIKDFLAASLIILHSAATWSLKLLRQVAHKTLSLSSRRVFAFEERRFFSERLHWQKFSRLLKSSSIYCANMLRALRVDCWGRAGKKRCFA